MLLHDLKLLLLPPALLAWLLVGPLRPGWTRWLGLQVLIACVLEPVAWWMARNGTPTVWLYNLYLPVDVVLLSLVLYEVGQRERRVVRELVLGFIVFGCAYLWQLTLYDLRTRFLSNALVIGGFVLMAQAALALYRQLDRSQEPLPRQPVFWVLLSMVVYSVAVTPVLGLMHYLHDRGSPYAIRMVLVNDGLFVLRYALVTYAFLLRTAQRNTRPA